MDTEDNIIKYVALYLRKSRGENEKDLVKHETELVGLCEENNWKYIEYKEIQSGDSIAMRPVMQSLLLDVENELFDAVCVVDIDRLGRGDLGDQDRIKKAFLNSNTLVVTPQYVYNLSNENDEFTVDIRSFIARMEYKQIVKRLVKGKKIGARLGQWTNGTPPFPYEYERWKDKYNQKGLVVNDDKLTIYRYIIDQYINRDVSTSQIAYDLNKKHIPSPRNKMWTNVTIGRILIDETHLGCIISNKTNGDGHKQKKPSSKKLIIIPKENWVIVKNCHEAVKTQEEHELVLSKLQANQKYFPRKEIKRTFALSGLIKCGVCGHTMQLYYREDRKTKELIKPCWYKNEVGEKCCNHGGSPEVLYHIIAREIDKKIAQLKNDIESSVDDSSIEDLYEELNLLKTQQIDKKNVINFIYDQYENGVYTKQRFEERRSKAESDVSDIDRQIANLSLKINNIKNNSKEDSLRIFNGIREKLKEDNTSQDQINAAYRAIISRIIYTRVDINTEAIISIEFK